jgi:hypothetical protein
MPCQLIAVHRRFAPIPYPTRILGGVLT